MFLLLLMGLGAASVKAQVRIGGNGAPNAAAVLDLNATDATNTGMKPLALPRVSLASTTDLLSNTTLLIGMLVYNTGGSLSTGLYYWNGTNWNRVDGATLGGDTIVGNEVTGAIINGGLTRSGNGTTVSPYTLGLAQGIGVNATLSTSTWSWTKLAWYLNWVGRVNFVTDPGSVASIAVPGLGPTSWCKLQEMGFTCEAGSGYVFCYDLVHRTHYAVSADLYCYALDAP